MKTSSRFLLLGVGVAVLTVAATTYWRQGEPSSGLRCDWRADNAASYMVTVSSSAIFYQGFVSGDKALPPSDISLSYKAQLDVRATKASERRNSYVATLVLIDGFADRSAFKADFARPFAFDMDENCRFGEFGFAADEGRESRELKKNLLLVMEAVAEPRGGVQDGSWQAKQVDAVGEYEATYQRDSESGEIIRTRLYYSKTEPFSPSLELKADVSKSVGRFVPDASFWVTKASAHESIRVRSMAGDPFVQSTADVTWTAADGGQRLAANAVTAIDLRWEPAHVQDTGKLSYSNYDKMGDPSVAYVSLADAMAAFAKGDFYGGNIDREAVANMVRYLKANPAEITSLLNKIKSGDIDERLHAFLFFTLTKVGTPEAQRALIKAIEDGDFTETNRMQAMHALADVAHPIPESVDALMGMAKSFGLEANDENGLESTALLALGVVERHQQGNEATAKELGKRAKDFLVDKLKSDIGNQERAVLIEALANTANPEVTPLIVEHFGDDSRMVRVSAARALSRMEAPEDQAILDAMQNEKITDTRGEIARAWADKGGTAGAYDYAKAAEMLSRESEESIRLALVDVLGRQAATQPAAKAALVKQFTQDPSPKVKYAIGKYLSADDLKGGSH